MSTNVGGVKRIVYILLCIVLGVIVTTIVHAVLELVYIHLLLSDFETWSLGFSWNVWYTLHYVLALVLLAIGIIGGYYTGVRWWNYIYVKKHLGLFARFVR
jgi:hypothetical protein